MSITPDGIRPRDLFWLWYDKLSEEEQLTAACEFHRFVTQAEKQANLQNLLNRLHSRE